jgi:hypothetical protein
VETERGNFMSWIIEKRMIPFSLYVLDLLDLYLWWKKHASWKPKKRTRHWSKWGSVGLGLTENTKTSKRLWKIKTQKGNWNIVTHNYYMEKYLHLSQENRACKRQFWR